MNTATNFRMTRSAYLAELNDLVLAIVRRHGELTVQAVQELANQIIVTRGITGAGDYVRSLPPLETSTFQ